MNNEKEHPMADKRGPMEGRPDLDIEPTSIDSAALARLVEEVRNKGETVSSTAYNRTYHRHNR